MGAGPGRSLLVRLEAVGEDRGGPVGVVHGAPRPGDVRDSLASLERAQATLGYQPGVSLREGLARTWGWFQSPPSGAAA